MLLLYRHLVQTFQFGYRLVCIHAFGIDLPVWLQAMLLLYRHLLQTFQFGYCPSLYTGFWYRLSCLSIGYIVFIQTFGTDFPVRLQFQFVYMLLVQTFQFGYTQCCFYIDICCRLSSLDVVLVCIQAFGIDFPVWLQTMFLLYRNLVQTFHFGYSSNLYTGFWNKLSSSSIGYVVFIQTFGTDFPIRLQFQFVYFLLVQTFVPVLLQAMLFLYRHLVQTFQFAYSSSLYTGFWYRHSSLVIDHVFIIQKFGTDFPFRLQF